MQVHVLGTEAYQRCVEIAVPAVACTGSSCAQAGLLHHCCMIWALMCSKAVLQQEHGEVSRHSILAARGL